MGCTESVPVANTFDEFHKPLGASLAANHGAPLPVVKEQLLVRENLFALAGEGFKIKDVDGRPYGGLRIRGKSLSLRDEMILENAKGNPVLVCQRKFQLLKQTFKIFTTRPNYPGQEPSKQKVGDSPLYTYATVEHSRPKGQSVWIETVNGCQAVYTVRRVGFWLPKKRVIKRFGQDVAYMEGKWDNYLLSVAPGIDSCLMICLCAICDEMDEDN